MLLLSNPSVHRHLQDRVSVISQLFDVESKQVLMVASDCQFSHSILSILTQFSL